MDKRPITVYSQVDGTAVNATSYYRVLQPLAAIERLSVEQGDPLAHLSDVGTVLQENEDRVYGQRMSDIKFHYHQCIPSQLQYEIELQGRRPLNKDGDTWYPPCPISDTDDDIMRVMPFNGAYRHLGVGLEQPDGSWVELGEGATVDAELPPHITKAESDDDWFNKEDGKWYRRMWEDGAQEGKKAIDFRANHIRIESWRRFMRLSRLVTCSTPRAEEYVKREVPTANTFVSPNMIDINHYPQDVELADHPNEVRILWQGSITHHECLWPLVDAFIRVAKKYPHAKFVFWGAPYKWLVEKLGDQARYVPWVPYPEYKARLSMMNHDIALCPLKPNIFNNSRSAIKAQESAIISKPAAVLAQNWGAYCDELVEGQTALLFSTPEEFEFKLGALIEDATLRKTLAGNLKQWTIDNRSPKVLAPRLLEAYRGALTKHREACGPPMELDNVAVPAEQPNLLAG